MKTRRPCLTQASRRPELHLGALRNWFTLSARQRYFVRACRQITKQFVQPRVGVNRWRVLLHQATGVRGWPVIAVQIASQHAKHGHLLATVMRGVRDAAGHHPRARALPAEEMGFALPPGFA